MDRDIARVKYDYNCKEIISLPPGHVLFINWHGKIGDAFISSFMFRELKKNYNSVKISVVTKNSLKRLYLDVFNADQVFVIDDLNIDNLIDLIPKLVSVDTVIPLIGILDFYHIYLLGTLHAANVFGTDPYLKMINRNYLCTARGLLVHDMFYQILSFLECKDIDDSYLYPPLQKINKYFRIIFNPFGSRKDKSLSQQKSIDILIGLATLLPNIDIGIVSSPMTDDDCNWIMHNIKDKFTNIHKIPDLHNIFDVIPYLNECSIVISVDTCIVHLAAGLNKKIVAIYYHTPGVFNCWLPRHDANVRFVYSLGPEQYIEKNMNNFDNREVFDATLNFLGDVNG